MGRAVSVLILIMRIAVYSTKSYDQASLEAANKHGHQFTFLKPRLEPLTAGLADGHDCVCAFVNDVLNVTVLNSLKAIGVRLIAMRCAGFNNVDIPAATRLGIVVARVPEYSPYSVAEHTIGMMLALNRQLPRAYNRVREGNFALKGLMGFDMHGRTAGVIGTGKIGAQVCRILLGIGCRVIAYDKFVNEELAASGVQYRPISAVLAESDILTLHCPLTAETYHLVNEVSLEEMKKGVMLINTSRGGLLDTRAVLTGLKSGKIGYLGLDVYEDEANLFFEDRSEALMTDDIFARLLTFPNVFITGHQAFFTREAIHKIACTTMENISAFESGGAVPELNRVS
jgi:D-lactate dehydrogenase